MNRPNNSFGHPAGITPKAQRWVERITKAAYAHRAHEMNVNVLGLPPNLMGSNNFSEVSMGQMQSMSDEELLGNGQETDEDNIFDIGQDLELVKFAKEYDFRRGERLDHEKWEKLFKEKIYKAAKGRTDIRINGEPWSVYEHDGIFAHKKFEEEQPVLFEEYSTWKTEKVLDKARLEKEHPKLYKQYQAATLRRLK